jgi:hypothetical protein
MAPALPAPSTPLLRREGLGANRIMPMQARKLRFASHAGVCITINEDWNVSAA